MKRTIKQRFIFTGAFVVLTCPPRIGPVVIFRIGIEKREIEMARRSYRPEQIIKKLRELYLF